MFVCRNCRGEVVVVQKFILLYLLLLSLVIKVTMDAVATTSEGVLNNSNSIMTWTYTFQRHLQKGYKK